MCPCYWKYDSQLIWSYVMLKTFSFCCSVLSHSVVSDSLWPHGLWPIRLLRPWGFSRQEYWSGLPFPPPGDLPNPGLVPRSPALQVASPVWATSEAHVRTSVITSVVTGVPHETVSSVGDAGFTVTFLSLLGLTSTLFDMALFISTHNKWYFL